MECVIPGPAVKVFGKTIHSLSKIGDELHFEATSERLILRTVNASRSAYACFQFLADDFFESYKTPSLEQNSQEESVKCKALNKCCLNVFRSLAHIEKNVQRCAIILDTRDCTLTFKLHCKHGIIKTTSINFEECDTLQAVYQTTDCANAVTAEVGVLSGCLANFQGATEELSINAQPDQLMVSNYQDPLRTGGMTSLCTRIRLGSNEFSRFVVDEPTTITFCLKELKALLSFSDFAELPTAMFFDLAGQPVVFSVACAGVEADFVLATIPDPGGSQPTTMGSSMRSTGQFSGRFGSRRNTDSQVQPYVPSPADPPHFDESNPNKASEQLSGQLSGQPQPASGQRTGRRTSPSGSMQQAGSQRDVPMQDVSREHRGTSNGAVRNSSQDSRLAGDGSPGSRRGNKRQQTSSPSQQPVSLRKIPPTNNTTPLGLSPAQQQTGQSPILPSVGPSEGGGSAERLRSQQRSLKRPVAHDDSTDSGGEDDEVHDDGNRCTEGEEDEEDGEEDGEDDFVAATPPDKRPRVMFSLAKLDLGSNDSNMLVCDTDDEG
eukprot:m.135505 g.135505  ORF g.135505 m.135505 type:complete len:548 (+) comp16954_c0_seq3:255-1898(+)